MKRLSLLSMLAIALGISVTELPRKERTPLEKLLERVEQDRINDEEVRIRTERFDATV